METDNFKDDTIDLCLHACDGKASTGTIEIYYWSKKRARRRGIYVCTFIYTMGFLASLSPALVIHLIVPPIWLLIGPYVSIKIIRAYDGHREFKRGMGDCPNCKSKVRFTGFKFAWPIAFECRTCGEKIEALPQDGDYRSVPLITA